MSTTATQSHAKFWDRIADKYSKRPVPDEAVYQKKLEITRAHLRPDMNVLELGCGTGSTAIVHAPLVSHIRAIDVSSKMIEIARGKADAQQIENITFEQSTIDDLHVPDPTFDAVLALSILHLLPNWRDVVDKVYKMVKPGGIFVTSTPCLGSSLKYAPLRLFLPIGRLFGLVPLVKFFSQNDLEDALTGAGFTIDYRWQPGPGKAVFIIAKRAE